ncbi:type II toxin-antitoxin system VapC family toxin [Mucilaginibacter terrae]|uniref:type II toxin-antitoxin system VapC family toxin n=1 Tax=Mucilaginibacter terrae TaxID=1955052 RepID=UPI00362AFDB9
MRVFFDTSSLFKLYFKEDGTNELDELFNKNTITEIFLSEITKVEFYSAVYNKFRTKFINENQAKALIDSFNADFIQYKFITVDNQIISSAQALLIKYGSKGLSALDSVQFASVLSVKHQIDITVTADKLLHDFFAMEHLPTFDH